MGGMISQALHYRNGSVCQAGVVIDDDPPGYATCDLSVASVNLGAILHTARNNVAKDTVTDNIAAGTNNTWHYNYECPDA